MAKRIQLEIGQEWAYNRSRQVFVGDYGFEKVIIKDVVPYEQSRWGGSRRKTNSGQGVLVSKRTYWSGEESWSDDVVQLSQLHYQWSEFEVARSEYEAKKKISDAAREVEKAKQEKFRQEVYVPALKEFVEAVQAVSGKRVSSYDEIGKLPVEVLQAITNSIKVSA